MRGPGVGAHNEHRRGKGEREQKQQKHMLPKTGSAGEAQGPWHNGFKMYIT